MSIGGVGGGGAGGVGGAGEFGNFGGAGQSDSGNMVGKGAEGGQQQGALDPEALKKLLAQLLGGAGGAGGSQGSGGSSGGGEDEQDPMRKQMSGEGQQQGIQMPEQNNDSVKFG